MVFSIQQLYRNTILLLCVVLMPLLAIGITVVTAMDSRVEAQHVLQTQANMLAERLLGQNGISEEDAKKILAPVAVNAQLQAACVFGLREVVEAHGPAFVAPVSNTLKCDEPVLRALGREHLVVRASISDDALPLWRGEVVLVAATPSLMPYLLRSLGFALLFTAVVGVLNWAIGIRLERMLLTPIRQIAMTAQRVSLYKDYSLRVVAGALTLMPREVEGLTDSFNAMLEEIEDRNKRLIRKSRELEKSQAEAVSANAAKSQFLANVSHELRTPLNAIIGFSTMLETEQFGPIGSKKYIEYARDINESGKHLLDVINDILDLTKAETGKLSVNIEPLNLQKIVEKALNIVAGQAYQRKIDIYTDIPAKLPKLYADRVRLVQILLNLLSNAIKFSDEGKKVVVRAFAEAAKNGTYYFTIEIEDQGIGMSKEMLSKAFQTFNQSDAGLNRKYDGAGLGLPLTKRLVELHHGKIKLESVEGKGTVVTVRLTSDPGLFT